MQNDAFDSQQEIGRDILREIDAGELDEEYLIKHASDYGKRANAFQLRSALQTISAKFLNLIVRFTRSKRISQTMKPVLRSITH